MQLATSRAPAFISEYQTCSYLINGEPAARALRWGFIRDSLTVDIAFIFSSPYRGTRNLTASDAWITSELLVRLYQVGANDPPCIVQQYTRTAPV